MWVMTRITLCSFAARTERNWKKENEELWVWAATVGGFSIMDVGRWAWHLPADLAAVPSVPPLTVGFDPWCPIGAMAGQVAIQSTLIRALVSGG